MQEDHKLYIAASWAGKEWEVQMHREPFFPSISFKLCLLELELEVEL